MNISKFALTLRLGYLNTVVGHTIIEIVTFSVCQCGFSVVVLLVSNGVFRFEVVSVKVLGAHGSGFDPRVPAVPSTALLLRYVRRGVLWDLKYPLSHQIALIKQVKYTVIPLRSTCYSRL